MLMNHKKISKGLGAAIAMAIVAAPVFQLEAATRTIPVPPARQLDSDTLDGVQQESRWGEVAGNQNRWNSLQDEEGEEIDFNRGTLSRRPRANRAPAGLEVKAADSPANDAGWKSTTVDEPRQITREATRSSGERPVLRRVSRTESTRAEAEVKKFVSEVSDPIARRKGMQEVSIIAGDLGFFPKTIFVSRDVPVRLFVTGASKASLCIMMDSFNVRKQVRSNKIEEIVFVPNQPGTFRYYCPVNGSEGTLVVKELTTAGAEES